MESGGKFFFFFCIFLFSASSLTIYRGSGGREPGVYTVFYFSIAPFSSKNLSIIEKVLVENLGEIVLSLNISNSSEYILGDPGQVVVGNLG